MLLLTLLRGRTGFYFKVYFERMTRLPYFELGSIFTWAVSFLLIQERCSLKFSSDKLIDYGKEWKIIDLGDPCQSPAGQGMCSRWGAQDHKPPSLALHSYHCIADSPVLTSKWTCGNSS